MFCSLHWMYRGAKALLRRFLHATDLIDETCPAANIEGASWNICGMIVWTSFVSQSGPRFSGPVSRMFSVGAYGARL